MDDALAKRGHSLEEAFFMERNAKLIEQRKKLEELQKTKETLTQVSGIRNEKVLDKLMELGVSPSVMASLSVLPLVEVAWADGQLSEAEKDAVLAEAGKEWLVKGSVNHELLAAWLKERPSAKFLEAWIYYIKGLRENLTAQQLEDLKAELLGRAKKVADAAGGFLGLSKISDEEKAVLKRMEDAFKG